MKLMRLMPDSTNSQKKSRIIVIESGSEKDEAWADILRGFLNWRLWLRLSGLEIKRRYRRTVIGPFWTSLSMAIFALAVGVVFSTLWRMPIAEYLPFLCAGMAAWILVSTMITEGCNAFIVAEGLVKQTTLPYSMFVLQNVTRNFMVFGHNAAVFALVGLIFSVGIRPETLLIIPGLLLVFFNGIWITTILAVLCARYRDIQPAVTSALQVAMLITPIFWPPEQAGNMRPFIVDPNPTYHLVNIIRAPLLGQAPDMLNWIVASVCAIVGCICAFYVFAKHKRSIIFWV